MLRLDFIDIARFNAVLRADALTRAAAYAAVCDDIAFCFRFIIADSIKFTENRFYAQIEILDLGVFYAVDYADLARIAGIGCSLKIKSI